MKHAKRIAALICVIAFCFTLVITPPAHAVGALGGQAAGAWIAAGLVALNIVAHTGAQAIGSYFGWQSAPTAQSVMEYAFPNSTQVISDYLNASTIQVRQGVTTIDGVAYDEVFVDPGYFTTGLKTNLFDFKSKWSILSGQSDITLAEGAGYSNGMPIYNVSGQLRTPTYSYTVNGGDYSLGNITLKSSGGKDQFFNYSVGSGNFVSYFNSSAAGQCYFRINNNNLVVHSLQTSGTWWQPSGQTQANFINQPFKYTYDSGVVPASESDIPEDYGLSIKIPHDQLQNFYNLYPQYNVDNSTINIQQDQIDIDQLTQAIFDQVTSMEQVKGEWKAAEEPVPPEPEPPGPVEDVLTGVNTIIGQQNTQISQNQQDLQIQQQQLQQQQQQLQQQQQINQNTSSIKETIENATKTPTTEELPDFKFDLRELFPFCIPFDIYRLLSSFDAEPQAPHVQIPVVIESIGFSYNLDLDFSAWDPVAQAMRTAELIVYAIALAWATGKVIKW